LALFAVVPAILCSSWLVKTTLQRVRLETLWSWSKEQGDRHIDCDKSVHFNGARELRHCAPAATAPSLVHLNRNNQHRANHDRSEYHTCVCCVERIYHIPGCCGHNAAFPFDTGICQQYSVKHSLSSRNCVRCPFGDLGVFLGRMRMSTS